MPYRSELEALKERHALLETNLQEILDVTENQRAQETAIREELAKTSAQLAALAPDPRRQLPLLDNVRVASPCDVEWYKMKGDERVRHCGQCQKNVYNLSEMTREEAETLVRGQEEGALCVTFFRRSDGTVLTSDCEVGAAMERRKRSIRHVALSAIGVLLLATVSAAATKALGCKVHMQVQGTMSAMPPMR